MTKGIKYIEAYKIKKGLILNFGVPNLNFKTLFRKQKHNRCSQSLNPDHHGLFLFTLNKIQ